MGFGYGWISWRGRTQRYRRADHITFFQPRSAQFNCPRLNQIGSVSGGEGNFMSLRCKSSAGRPDVGSSARAVERRWTCHCHQTVWQLGLQLPSLCHSRRKQGQAAAHLTCHHSVCVYVCISHLPTHLRPVPCNYCGETGLQLEKVSMEVCCRCPRFARSMRVRLYPVSKLPKLWH